MEKVLEVLEKNMCWRVSLKKGLVIVLEFQMRGKLQKLTKIEEKMVNARVFGGMHLRQSGYAGQQLGHDIADYIVDKFLLPVA